MDQRQLRREQVGRLLAARLVVGVELVAVRAPAGRVERDRDVVGLLVGEHLGEHRREAVDRVGDRARLGREVGRQREEGPVRERVAVEQQQLRHRRRWYVPADDSDCRQAYGVRSGRERAGHDVARDLVDLACGSPSPSSGGTATTRPRVMPCSSISRPLARSMILRASSRSARSAFSFSSATICSKRPSAISIAGMRSLFWNGFTRYASAPASRACSTRSCCENAVRISTARAARPRSCGPR